jgi:hypothetical protein
MFSLNELLGKLVFFFFSIRDIVIFLGGIELLEGNEFLKNMSIKNSLKIIFNLLTIYLNHVNISC